MRSRFLAITLAVFSTSSLYAQGQNVTPVPTSGQGFRIAGIIVSKTDGHPLVGARVALASTEARQKAESVTTSEDGKFEFTGVPAGKYSLSGAKRGYIAAGYDQHDQYSTAIVTGAGLDTEHLILKLDPQAIISGRVLDETGEPVRDATVTLYRDNHFSGVHQVQTFRGAQTNDLGEFEIPDLVPGTYFMSASAQPWYAVHPQIEGNQPGGDFDRSLDAAYPITYYGDATDPDSATPISVRGGEHLQAEVHMNPVPSLHVLIHVPDRGNHQYPFPQFEQPAFDGSVPVMRMENRMVTPGTWEITGIPAGKYDVRLMGPNVRGQINGVELNSTTQELDTSNAEPMCSLQVSVSFEDAPPSGRYAVMLRGKSARITPARNLDSKGQADFENLAPGTYEVFVLGVGSRFSVGRIRADGAAINGHTITLAAGSSASVTISAVKGSAEIEGIVKRSGKPFAGAMVVLVPRNPEGNSDLFRRDQSDLDGSFTLRNIVPGSYTLLAIENGWDLDWSKPDVISAYLPRGRKIEVGGSGSRSVMVAEDVEVLSK